MTRTVVSGGTGYVGRFIVEGLLAAGHTVTVLGRTRPHADFFSAPVAFQPHKLGSEIPVDAFSGADFFVHAAFDHVPGKYRGGEGEDPASFRRRNLEGSVALFEAARQAGIGRTIFLSSRAVYGPRPSGTWLDEADKAAPDTLYGEVKLAAENALQELCDDRFQTTSLRVTGVYGPAARGRAHKWAALFADYLAGKPIAPRAGTEVHGADVAQAVRLVLEHPGTPPALLNVSDILVDRHDLLKIVRDLTGNLQPLPQRADASSVNAMKTDRLRALGWKPGGSQRLAGTVSQLLQEDI
jgi:nucleoside-diphosphate-sugar epimerase